MLFTKKTNYKTYKLFTFLSVAMEIWTPWSSQVHLEAQLKVVHATDFRACFTHVYVYVFVNSTVVKKRLIVHMDS
jgi:hypothetical protein